MLIQYQLGEIIRLNDTNIVYVIDLAYVNKKLSALMNEGYEL